MKKNMPHRFLVGLALLALGIATAGSLAAQEERRAAPPETTTSGGSLASLPIVRERLDNGLRVVMSPDRSVPTVAIAVYYDVGSRNEVRGRSGFAHLFEHMMFQGSANVAKGEHFSLIMNRGGSLNGTTSHDRTNYYETLPSNELALGLWLEADRMESLAITEENFENQRQVVMEEWRQSYRNQPYALSSLRINELAFGDYWPYAHSTIGDIQDLENAPLEAVQEFFRTYYAPNNAVIGISGDFEPSEAMALVRQYFGDLPSRDIPEFNPPALAPQTSERTDTMVDPLAQLPAFHMGWHIPPNRADDHYALEMLALILGQGDSSRLYQELVKDEALCQSVYVGTDDRRGPDLFSVWAIMAAGESAEEAQGRINAQITSVSERGVTARELQKAQNALRSVFVFGLQSNLQRAQNLAQYELYYDNAELLREELGHYLEVSREDIQRVAGRYFAPTNRTVLDVVPPPASEGASE
ncbi:MAG: M16 family metallopeptidase [Sandaracinaceae bacterium]